MKRQVAITGPTPEFLRWSIRQSCRLRADTKIDSVDQTEKRLRAIRAAALAAGQGRIFDGIAARYFDGIPKGFRVEEVFHVFGGFDKTRISCQACPANVLDDALNHGELAGCHGWLPSPTVEFDLESLMELEFTPRERAFAASAFLNTDPIWYGLWAAGSLHGSRLKFVADVFGRIFKMPGMSDAAGDFLKVLDRCVQDKLTLDVELVPPGFSDGLRWTISAHCDRCKAEFSPNQNGCRICNKTGSGHPVIHKKVLGLRPWVDLGVVIGPEKVAAFLEQHKIDGNDANHR